MVTLAAFRLSPTFTEDPQVMQLLQTALLKAYGVRFSTNKSSGIVHVSTWPGCWQPVAANLLFSYR